MIRITKIDDCERFYCRLPLGIRYRLLSIHDTIMLLLQLVENPPWEYYSRETETNFKYIGNKWSEVKSENRLKIEKYDAQVLVAILLFFKIKLYIFSEISKIVEQCNTFLQHIIIIISFLKDIKN